MKRLGAAALTMALLGLASAAMADADKSAGPTGSWKWSFTPPGGQEMEFTLKLKADGDKLTGTMSGSGRRGAEAKIQDGSFKDGTVSFKVSRGRPGGQKRIVTYSGKLSGDTITGKMTFERMGEEQSIDWEAKRAK